MGLHHSAAVVIVMVVWLVVQNVLLVHPVWDSGGEHPMLQSKLERPVSENILTDARSKLKTSTGNSITGWTQSLPKMADKLEILETTAKLPQQKPTKIQTHNTSTFSYFTVVNRPCKNGATSSSNAPSRICRAPTQLPKEQCSIEIVNTTYEPGLGQRPPFWTRIFDEHGKRNVHINTHDPRKEDIYISAGLHDKGMWDEYVLGVFRHVLGQVPPARRASQLVVDVGANIGYFSLIASAYGIRTISFEPMRFNMERMISSIRRNAGFSQRMRVYNMAVSNSHGVVSLKATSATTNAGNFFIQEELQQVSAQGTYGVDHVNSAALDEIIDEDVLLMKVDVETHEPFVLDGAQNLLCQHIVRHIVIEFDKNQQFAHGGACPPGAMLNWMDELGYDVSDVIVGAPKIDVKDADFKKMPPNIWFSLRDHSMSPAKRLGGGNTICKRSDNTPK